MDNSLTKGNGSGSEETPEETVKPGAIAISVGSKKKKDNGTVSAGFSGVQFQEQLLTRFSLKTTVRKK